MLATKGIFMEQDCTAFTSTELFADFGSRLKAVLLDTLIYVVAIFTLIPLFNKLALTVHLPYLSGILAIALFIGFEAVQVTFWGRTLGHKVFGLRVINSAGKNPNFLQALGRFFVKTILGIWAFLSMLGGSGKTVHDIVSRTRVIYAR